MTLMMKRCARPSVSASPVGVEPFVELRSRRIFKNLFVYEAIVSNSILGFGRVWHENNFGRSFLAEMLVMICMMKAEEVTLR